MTQPLEYFSPGYNASDGMQMGRTTSKKLGFYGATPVSRPIGAATNMVSTVSTTSISTASIANERWGFLTQQELVDVIAAVSTVQYTLKQLGLIAS